MTIKKIKTDAVSNVLEQEGFHLEQMVDTKGETEALFMKPRPGGTSIFVTVSMNCDCYTERALRRLMATAGIPLDKYKHLLK